jgi:cob(I)alamin adenosyltransferase
VDEASSALGLARSLSADARVVEIAEELQRTLYAVGAELGTNPEAGKSFAVSGAADVERLEVLMHELEQAAPMPAEFILPGATPASAALDLARAITRRAERRCVTLHRAGALGNDWVIRRLNRLSLLLFVLARYEESVAGRPAEPAKSSRPTRSN